MEYREESEETQSQAPLPPQQSLTAQPPPLQPLEVFGEDEKGEASDYYGDGATGVGERVDVWDDMAENDQWWK